MLTGMYVPPARAGDGCTGLSGQVVLQRYRLDSELGSGSLGVVYRATELATGNAVAAKVMRPELREAPAVEARFLREARLTRRLEHPYIPRGLAAGLAPSKAPMLVMEFVDGENLRARVERVGPLPVNEVFAVALATSEALAYAHEQRVVHRDVKPGNLMFARAEAAPENVRVLDFGLSFCLDEPRLTASVTLVGTPAYIAPEQARGEPATPAADLYSLAATLVHLATGETLYSGSWLEQVDAHARAPLPDLRARRPELSPAFARLLAAMLEKRPDQRPANAREVVLALRAIMP